MVVTILAGSVVCPMMCAVGLSYQQWEMVNGHNYYLQSICVMSIPINLAIYYVYSRTSVVPTTLGPKGVQYTGIPCVAINIGHSDGCSEFHGLLWFLASYIQPIKDPLRKGQPLYKGHSSGPLSHDSKDKLSTEDKVADPKVSFIQRL